MKVVKMVFEVTETCQNGNERTIKKTVYGSGMFQFEEAKAELEKRHYYNVLMLSADWVDVITVGF